MTAVKFLIHFLAYGQPVLVIAIQKLLKLFKNKLPNWITLLHFNWVIHRHLSWQKKSAIWRRKVLIIVSLPIPVQNQLIPP